MENWNKISGELKQAEIKKKKKNSKEKLFRQTIGKQFSPIIKEERDKWIMSLKLVCVI